MRNTYPEYDWIAESIGLIMLETERTKRLNAELREKLEDILLILDYSPVSFDFGPERKYFEENPETFLEIADNLFEGDEEIYTASDTIYPRFN